jgi:hypothetical protein
VLPINLLGKPRKSLVAEFLSAANKCVRETKKVTSARAPQCRLVLPKNVLGKPKKSLVAEFLSAANKCIRETKKVKMAEFLS